MIKEQKIEQNKWLFKQFTIINRTAMNVYEAIQGGIGQNFYNCYSEYENGVFGWLKETNAFTTALNIYEQYTNNDAWDIISQLEDEFGDDLGKFTYDKISEYELQLEEIEE